MIKLSGFKWTTNDIYGLFWAHTFIFKLLLINFWQSEVCKIAPTVTESPQLKLSFVRLQARTWSVRRDLSWCKPYCSASKI